MTANHKPISYSQKTEYHFKRKNINNKVILKLMAATYLLKKRVGRGHVSGN